MIYSSWPQTGDMLKAFSYEIEGLGGAVTESFDDGKRLYVRATLPELREVSPGDNVQGGVALRATETDMRVHPYIFRLVCANGAIRAEAMQSRVVEREQPLGDPIVMLRGAVQACAVPAAFERSASEMRATMLAQADMALMLMPLLKSLPPNEAERVLDTVFQEYNHGGHRNGFGLMNAVTATARETRDPELRWRLEALGGGIGALLWPITPIQRSSRSGKKAMTGMVA